MPKIIENLEEKIFDTALELFGEHGYSGVDMKKIAKKVGIAVGTLYNYYPNKKQIFIDVFNKSWEETFAKLDTVIENQISSREKIKELIEVLYDEMYSRKGLGRQLIQANVFGENGISIWSTIQEELFKRARILISNLKTEENIKIEDGKEVRLIETIFISMTVMLSEHREEKEQNIDFLNCVMDSILTK